MRTKLDREKNYVAQFDRFEIEMSGNAALDCSHSGDCAADVAAHAPQVQRSERCTAEALQAELKEYGAWDAEELADDAENWQRIIWIAAGNIIDGDGEEFE